MEEAAGTAERLADLAQQAATDPEVAAELNQFVEGEPVDSDEDLLIPLSEEERAAERDLARRRYRGWAATASRAGAGGMVGRVASAAAGVPGQLASQIPAALNMAHTGSQARAVQAIANQLTDEGDLVYRGAVEELRHAMSKVARIRGARASGQASSIATSAAVSTGGTAAVAAVIAGTAIAASFPPVALALLATGAVTGASVAASQGVGRITRATVEAFSDLDRDHIARALLEGARAEIAFNASRGDLSPVREFAVEVLTAIGVTRALLEDMNQEHRVQNIIRRYLS